MKVLAVIGSPHKNGPSSTITNEILNGAKAAGHEIKVYNINEMDIKGCQACGYCKEIVMTAALMTISSLTGKILANVMYSFYHRLTTAAM